MTVSKLGKRLINVAKSAQAIAKGRTIRRDLAISTAMAIYLM